MKTAVIGGVVAPAIVVIVPEEFAIFLQVFNLSRGCVVLIATRPKYFRAWQ